MGFDALVVGANRGIGYSLCAELLRRRAGTVGCAVRDPVSAGPFHRTLPNFEFAYVVRLDYRDHTTIMEVAEVCSRRVGKLDLLINCGGANVAEGLPVAASKGPLGEISEAALRVLYEVNAIGPMLTTQALLRLLSASECPRVINIGSSRGSLVRAAGGSIGYSMSKAALNMGTTKIAAEVAARGGGAVVVDPGWVRTRMGGTRAPDHPDVVARKIVDNIVDRVVELNGCFVDVDGDPVPW